MLKFTPLKTQICSLTKQTWDAEGSRSSRRVVVVNVKKELMGSQILSVVVTWAMMASMVSMVASTASMVLMAPRATMVLASAALKASGAGAPALRWNKLRNKLLVHHPEDLLVRRWSYNSGMIAVENEFGMNSSKFWLGSTTILAVEDDGPRRSRRVDDAYVKKELMGCQSWALVGGVDGWRRWMASKVGVDGGLGSSTQRALTWKCFCVPSGEGGTHSGSIAFRLNSLQNTSGFLSLRRVLDL